MSRSLHHKIICRQQILTPIAAGEQQESWQDIAAVWADITVKSSDVVQTARQNHFAASYKITVRYQERLLNTRNILWQGREYHVVGLSNPDNRKHILAFDVVENNP